MSPIEVWLACLEQASLARMADPATVVKRTDVYFQRAMELEGSMAKMKKPRSSGKSKDTQDTGP